LTNVFLDALTDRFVDVFPVLDSVGKYRFDDGFQGTGNGLYQTIAFFLAEDFIDQDVWLDEVAVVFTQGVCLTDQVTIGFPGHIDCTFFVGPRVTKGVWYVWTTSAGVFEPHAALEVV